MRVSDEMRKRMLYYDPEYVSTVFELFRGETPVTQISNSLGFSGNLSTGIAGLGTTLQETKIFKTSSMQMIESIRGNLEALPEFDEANHNPIKGTQLAWIQGNLTIGEWKDSSSVTNQVFELATSGKSHTLVVQKNLFASGLGLLLDMDSIVSHGIDIPVIMLGRILFFNALVKNFTTSPCLIFENGL